MCLYVYLLGDCVKLRIRSKYQNLILYFMQFPKRYTFKLHFIFNTHGEIVRMQITGGNVNDRSPVMNLMRDISAKLIGDKG